MSKRGHPATSSTTAAEESVAARDRSTVDDKVQPLTHRGRKLAASKADPNKDER